MNKVMVTGASGFIGKFVCAELAKQQMLAQAVVRNKIKLPPNLQQFATEVPSLSVEVISQLDFTDIDCVIHLAATAHIPATGAADELETYRRMNCDTSLALAKAAALAGVRRFVFISSIGVNGLCSAQPFTAQDAPAPQEAYAVSKYEAEQALRRIAAETALELVIIRPPLVYGSGAPGNFGKLCQLAFRPLPLPFGCIHNKRSLVAVENLVDLVLCCVVHSAAAGQTFLVSDDQDISTSNLLRTIISASGGKAWLIPFPVNLLRLMGSFVGKSAVINRFCSNLQLDITHTKQTLGWVPPITLEEGIKRCFEDA